LTGQLIGAEHLDFEPISRSQVIRRDIGLGRSTGRSLPGDEQPANGRRAISATHTVRKYGFMIEHLFKIYSTSSHTDHSMTADREVIAGA
jgi:hypothetical protein